MSRNGVVDEVANLRGDRSAVLRSAGHTRFAPRIERGSKRDRALWMRDMVKAVARTILGIGEESDSRRSAGGRGSQLEGTDITAGGSPRAVGAGATTGKACNRPCRRR